MDYTQTQEEIEIEIEFQRLVELGELPFEKYSYISDEEYVADELNEAEIELMDFAFTIQIPAFKRINFLPEKVVYQQYGKLTPQTQEKYIRYLIDCHITFSFDIYFEKHKDGRIHCHGRVKDISLSQLLAFRSSVLSDIGVKAEKQQFQVFHYRQEYYKVGWQAYITKEQQQRKLSFYLDKK